MKKSALILIFILFCLKVSAQDSLAIKPVVNILEKKSFKINIPSGWRVNPECQELNCSLFSPNDTLSAGDSYIENINITIEKLPSTSYTAEQYTTFSISYLPKVVKNFKLLKRTKINQNLVVIEYQGHKSNFEQSWRQYFHVKNAKVYIVTLATETPKFNYYKTLTEPYLKSFKVL
jgi:hypothetical protein